MNKFQFKSILRYLSFLYLFTANIVNPQSVFESVGNNDIYDFLDRLSQKGIIHYNDLIKPLPRKIILQQLLSAYENFDLLTDIEKKELEFFKKDFGFEQTFVYQDDRIKRPFTYVGKDNYDRYHLFSYEDDFFKLNISPILGFEYGLIDNKKATHFWNGVSLYGYVGDNIGFSFDFRDNRESGDNIDRTDGITQKPAVTGIKNVNPNTIEYSKVNANVSIDWKWGSFAVGKEFIEWGYGDNGLIVMSQKAPSFPLLRLDINPVEWLSFNYFHAWLNSDVIDSSSFYYTEHGDLRFSYRNKFMASHTLTIRPTRGLDIALGESIVYSDQLEHARRLLLSRSRPASLIV